MQKFIFRFPTHKATGWLAGLLTFFGGLALALIAQPAGASPLLLQATSTATASATAGTTTPTVSVTPGTTTGTVSATSATITGTVSTTPGTATITPTGTLTVIATRTLIRTPVGTRTLLVPVTGAELGPPGSQSAISTGTWLALWLLGLLLIGYGVRSRLTKS